MLKQAQKFERVFEAFDYVDPHYKSELLMGDKVSDQKNWACVRRLCTFLKKFYNLIVKVSRCSYITSNNCFNYICSVYASSKDWQLNPNVKLNSMAKRMKDKYNKYWGNMEKMNMLLYIASFLDPKKKIAFVEFCFIKMYYLDQL